MPLRYSTKCSQLIVGNKTCTSIYSDNDVWARLVFTRLFYQLYQLLSSALKYRVITSAVHPRIVSNYAKINYGWELCIRVHSYC